MIYEQNVSKNVTISKINIHLYKFETKYEIHITRNDLNVKTENDILFCIHTAHVSKTTDFEIVLLEKYDSILNKISRDSKFKWFLNGNV